MIIAPISGKSMTFCQNWIMWTKPKNVCFSTNIYILKGLRWMDWYILLIRDFTEGIEIFLSGELSILSGHLSILSNHLMNLNGWKSSFSAECENYKRNSLPFQSFSNLKIMRYWFRKSKMVRYTLKWISNFKYNRIDW